MANIVAHCAVVEELRSTIAQWQLYATAWRRPSRCTRRGCGLMRLAARPRRRSELTWLVSGADDDQTSTTAPRSLTDLPADGWPSSTTVPHLSRQTFCRRGRPRHMVGKSRRSGCRRRTREGPAGGVLSVGGDLRHTVEKGSDRGPTLVELRGWLVVVVRWSNLYGRTVCGR